MSERIKLPNKQEGVVFLPVRNGKCIIETRIKNGSGYFMHNRCLSGAIEVGETPAQTVFREALEEAGIIAERMVHLDTFEDSTLNNNFIRLHAFLVSSFIGEIRQSEIEKEKSILHIISLEEARWCLSFASSRLTLMLAQEELSR